MTEMVTTTGNRCTKLNSQSTISVGQLFRRHYRSTKSKRNLIDIVAKTPKEPVPILQSTDVEQLAANMEKPPKSIASTKRELRKNRGIRGIHSPIRMIIVWLAGC